MNGFASISLKLLRHGLALSAFALSGLVVAQPIQAIYKVQANAVEPRVTATSVDAVYN